MSKDIYQELLKQWMQTSELEEVEEELEGVKLSPVESSNLAAVGYDAKRRELVVAFLDGSVYRYYKVEASTYQELISASSHGRYFYWNIRMAYSFDRIIG